MKVTDHGAFVDGDVADGLLMCIRKLFLSTSHIRSILPFRGSWFTHILELEINGFIVSFNRKNPRAFYPETINCYRNFIDNLDVEDDYPCAYFFPIFYVLGKKITWKVIYAQYFQYVHQENELD